MAILFHEDSKTFHLYNDQISYIFKILENNQLGQLYFGKKIADRSDFERMYRERACVLAPCAFEGNLDFSLELAKQEYPTYGTGDYRDPAFMIQNKNGDRITDFVYKEHTITRGKEVLPGLPSVHATKEDAEVLSITLTDTLLQADLILTYTIFFKYPVIARSARLVNHGENSLTVERMMSLALDLNDMDYEMVQLDGAWSRERHIHKRKLVQGIQSVSSTRGTSSASHNPFIALQRPTATQHTGEVYGFNLIYSGNFLSQVEVDCYDCTRVMLGINPFDFSYTLDKGEEFQTPEAVLCYSDKGMNGLSQAFHEFYRTNLMKSKWADKERPILINNWEATYFDFDEERIVNLASKAKEVGVELFVLDDGWFGERNDDTSSLGDWYVNKKKLVNGIKGLSEKIHDMGLLFGLWFEPEMVNEISNLYKEHADWVVSVPNRKKTYGRNQFVLDFSNPVVVQAIFEQMDAILTESKIDYIKWDMNRNITEAFTAMLPAHRQKEFCHRYILGVYRLYEMLTTKYPDILFESCASGGARFDAGMLYYAPQAWCSDDTDAVERLAIQTGTSLAYPVCSMGAHVSAVPNHQLLRETSLDMRANIAFFGAFGYELNLLELDQEQIDKINEQIVFYKKYRKVFQFGTFYRILTGENGYYSFLTVSEDKKTAILTYNKVLATPNPSLKVVKLAGLSEEVEYFCEQRNESYYGDELMNFGLIPETEFTGMLQGDSFKGKYTSGTDRGDFTSQIYVFRAIE